MSLLNSSINSVQQIFQQPPTSSTLHHLLTITQLLNDPINTVVQLFLSHVCCERMIRKLYVIREPEHVFSISTTLTLPPVIVMDTHQKNILNQTVLRKKFRAGEFNLKTMNVRSCAQSETINHSLQDAFITVYI